VGEQAPLAVVNVPRDKLFGHVFGGGRKSRLVEGGDDGGLRAARDYVHLIPGFYGVTAR
jgi:hypothetical protein